MNLNTICLRIFYVLFLLVVGGPYLFLYALRVLTPLAICVLPTETAQAHYAKPSVSMEYHLDSKQVLYHSEITYAGRTATLLTRTSLTPLPAEGKELAQFQLNLAELKSGLRPTQWEEPPDPEFTVRYVRAFPFFVARDIPNGSLWRYYAETWMARDFISFLFMTCLVTVVAFLFYRHLRASRRRHNW